MNSKWIKDLNVRPETIELLEQNTANRLFDINHSKFPSDPPPRIKETKIKLSKWDVIKLKSLCTGKKKIRYNKIKRQPSEWDTVIINEATDKSLISKIYKQLI